MQGNVPFIQWDLLSWKFYKPNTFIYKCKTKVPMPKVRWWPLAGESKKMTLTPIFPYDKHSMVYDSILDL